MSLLTSNTMIIKCSQCNKEFEALRITRKFCSDKCKVAFSRVTVTNDKKVSVTKLNVTKANKCKYCEKPLDWDLQEVCYKCCLERKEIPYKRPAEKSDWIPNWKRSGCKSREEALKSLWDIIQQHEGRYMFQGYKIDTSK